MIWKSRQTIDENTQNRGAKSNVKVIDFLFFLNSRHELPAYDLKVEEAKFGQAEEDVKQHAKRKDV